MIIKDWVDYVSIAVILICSAAAILVLLYTLVSYWVGDGGSETLVMQPEPITVNTWRDDFDAWKADRISLDEFLDRRWNFRQNR